MNHLSTPRNWDAKMIFYLFVLLLIIFMAQAPGARAAETPPATYAGNNRGSWGLGVVVPQGSKLSSGGSLSWAQVRNVTVLVEVPAIVSPTETVYATMSVMTNGGVVLQTALGIYPGNTSWLVYSMFIADVGAYPQNYQWVVNSSGPPSLPHDWVALSIFESASSDWGFSVTNLRTGSFVNMSFESSVSGPLKVGDQEVFALESYSWEASDFQNMTDMNLKSIMVDGETVLGGWYFYADWDPTHNPLFVVGGAPPPDFIAMESSPNETAVWQYSGEWFGGIQQSGVVPVVFDELGLVGAALIAVGLVIIRRHRGGKKRPKREGCPE